MTRMNSTTRSRRHHVDVRNSRLLRAIWYRTCIVCLSHARANPEQENADRSACHDWAVIQSGYDPTLVYAAQRGIMDYAERQYVHLRRRYPAPGGIVGVRGNADIRRLNELYDAYLRAGRGLLRGQRLPSYKIGASNANFDL